LYIRRVQHPQQAVVGLQEQAAIGAFRKNAASQPLFATIHSAYHFFKKLLAFGRRLPGSGFIAGRDFRDYHHPKHT
jgi:hypothetical protein